MLVLTAAMGLKTVVTKRGSGSFLMANGPMPAPPMLGNGPMPAPPMR